MLKSEELEDVNSCFNRARLDEPIFVFKATDPDAPEAIITWCNLYWERHRKAKTLTKERITKQEKAMVLARAMIAWRLAHKDDRASDEVPQKPTMFAAIKWVLNDMAYKAPETINADMAERWAEILRRSL